MHSVVDFPPNSRNNRLRAYISAKTFRWHSGWDRPDPPSSDRRRGIMRIFLFHGVNIFLSLKLHVALDELPGRECVGFANRWAHWAGDAKRGDRSWRLISYGGGGRDADEERRGSLASPVPWMRAARQSSAVAWRVRHLLSVLRRHRPVVSPPGQSTRIRCSK
jgi:hypothetical protein